MALQIISVQQDTPSWIQETTLDGAVYQILFRWNERESAWYYGLMDAAGASIAAGKLVTNIALLAGNRSVRRPPGELMAQDMDKAGEPGYSDLGGRVEILYLEKASIP